MEFSLMSDGIRLHHASHHGYDDDEPDGVTAGGHGLLTDPGAPVTDSFFLGHHAGVDPSAMPELAQGNIASEHHVATASSLAAAAGFGPIDHAIGGGSIESGETPPETAAMVISMETSFTPPCWSTSPSISR